MSSLQKFHRRTNGGVPVVKLLGSESPVAGGGFYMGLAGDGTSYMYQAPKSTEGRFGPWGSKGTTRGTISTTNGISNTNTLASLGSAAHPAATNCKNLTTGGYNTWYLPAKDELMTLWTNRNSNAAQAMSGNYSYASSTEDSSSYAWYFRPASSSFVNSGSYADKSLNWTHRAVRRALV